MKIKFHIIDRNRVHIGLGKGAWTTIDFDDYATHPEFRNQVWFRDPNRQTCYAQTKVPASDTLSGHTTLRAHRLVMGESFDVNFPTVDHVNGDGLDNRRENLRWASFKTQNQNRHGLRDERSLYVCLRDSFLAEQISAAVVQMNGLCARGYFFRLPPPSTCRICAVQLRASGQIIPYNSNQLIAA